MTSPAPWDRWTGRPGSAARPPIRIGDAEREDAVVALGEHFATGRLTHQEYDERADAALRARTAADVAPLFADLPAPHPSVLTGAPLGAVRRPPKGPAGAVARTATEGAGRRASHIPLLPLLLVLVGLSLLLQEGAVLLLGLAVVWWVASVRWRRARAQWAARWHGPAGHAGHRHRI